MTPCNAIRRLRKNDSVRSTLLYRFLTGDGGQDVVEYALLAGFIGIAGWAALNFIADTVGTTYTARLDPAAGVPSAWDPAEPLGSGQ
jgi:Flp pilus assembly pilin Flp